MPVHDRTPRRSGAARAAFVQERAQLRRLIAKFKRRPDKRRDGEAGETVPVDPTRPGTLDGGAAVALEFGD